MERWLFMTTLPKVAFGNTGLKVTPLGLGAAQVGNAKVSEAEAERLLNGVLDAGVNLIDTARGYGLSEDRIGKYIAHRRDEYVLSTKVGYDVEVQRDWTKDAVLAGIERALRLLRTDVLDIAHLHSCELAELRAGEVIEGLSDARQAGKIKVAAYSGENEALADAIASGGFQSVQFSVNLCDQRAIDTFIPSATSRGLGVIAKRPVANVFWRFADRPRSDYAEEYWLRARAMQLTPPEGMDWYEFALRFAVFTPGVHTSLVGTGSLAHFQQAVAAVARGPLPDHLYQFQRNLFIEHDHGWEGQV
jgi:aryl-alcohol dehydrogenase-like predicted oxidoreductase